MFLKVRTDGRPPVSRLARLMVFLLTLSMSGCVGAQPPSPVRDNSGYTPQGSQATPPVDLHGRVEVLLKRLEQLEKANRTTTADLSRRLALMENEVHQLRGDLDVALHRNERLAEQLEALRSAKATAPAAVAPPPGSSLPGMINGSAGGGAAAVDKAPAAAAPMAGSSRELYDASFQQLKRGEYEPAKAGFTRFLKQHPDDGLADNAQYWIGELEYVQRHFSEALVAFNQVLIRWPASAKVPASLLKIGFAFHELGDRQNARASLMRLITDYPHSPAVAMAKQRLQLIDDAAKTP